MRIIKAFKYYLRYTRTVRYLFKKRGLRAVLNFIYVKLFVTEGEGSAGLLLRPFTKHFPGLVARWSPYPRNVEIEMTTICDKHCVLCEHTYWKDQEERHLTLEEFKTIVNNFPKLKWVNLTGEGDAFLNPDYLEMIAYLKNKDVPVFLVDSFDLINQDVAKKIIEMGVDGIWVSFDAASPEMYNRLKKGCDFDRTISNVKNMIRLKKELHSPIPEICFRFIINTMNIREMPEFISLIASLGKREELGDGSTVEFVGLLTFKEIKKYFVEEIPPEIIDETLKKAERLGVSVRLSHENVRELPPLEKCTAWLEPYFMMGGYALPCCAVMMSNQRTFLRENAFGNIFQTPFREIWDSKRYQRFRRMVTDPEAEVPILCRGCRAYDTKYREKRFGVSKSV